jgi:hypothetical protein
MKFQGGFEFVAVHKCKGIATTKGDEKNALYL